MYVSSLIHIDVLIGFCGYYTFRPNLGDSVWVTNPPVFRDQSHHAFRRNQIREHKQIACHLIFGEMKGLNLFAFDLCFPCTDMASGFSFHIIPWFLVLLVHRTQKNDEAWKYNWIKWDGWKHFNFFIFYFTVFPIVLTLERYHLLYVTRHLYY